MMSESDSFEKRRKSIRLPEYNYASPGAYFVTLCTHQSCNFFGEIAGGKILLNEAGEMVKRWWLKIPDKFPTIQLDTYILMPNHLHGIIKILESNNQPKRVGADPCVRPEEKLAKNQFTSIDATLPDIVKWFKTMSTNEFIRGIKLGKWDHFNKHLWQRSYYDHVIRKLSNISEVREYIENNPLRWVVKKKVK